MLPQLFKQTAAIAALVPAGLRMSKAWAIVVWVAVLRGLSPLRS